MPKPAGAHLIQTHPGTDCLPAQIPDGIRMAVVQLFDGKIHLFVPGDVRVEQQTGPVGDGADGYLPTGPVGILFQMFLPFGNGPVDLAQLPEPLPDQLLLLPEKGLGIVDIQIGQISADPIGGKPQLPQIPDDRQPVNILQAVKPVAVFTAARPYQTKTFVIAERIGADAVQLCQLLDPVFVFHCILHIEKFFRRIKTVKVPAHKGS